MIIEFIFGNKAKSFLAKYELNTSYYTAVIETSLWLPVADTCCPTESFFANMNSVQLKTKDLLRFHSGYHGDQVSIATRWLLYQETSIPNMKLI